MIRKYRFVYLAQTLFWKPLRNLCYDMAEKTIHGLASATARLFFFAGFVPLWDCIQNRLAIGSSWLEKTPRTTTLSAARRN
jgi:hypothetical protein